MTGRFARVAGNALFGVLAAIIGVAILGLTVLPSLLRYQTYVVLSGSMEPAIHTGAVIVSRSVDPNSLQIGDIITYQPAGSPESITHRIIQIKGSAAGKTFVTKGDANSSNDLGDVKFDRAAGKFAFSVPLIGYVFKFIGSPTMRLLFIVVPGLLLLGSWLWDVWKPDAKLKMPADESVVPATPVRTLTEQNLEMGRAADASAVIPLRQ